MLCRSVSVLLTVSSAKTAGPIKMPFGSTDSGPRNHVLDGGQDPSPGEGITLGRIMRSDVIIAVVTC